MYKLLDVFYALPVAIENPVARESGITVLQLYDSSFSFLPFDTEFQEQLLACLELFSLKRHYIAVCRSPRRESARYVDETVSELMHCLRKYDENCILICHSFIDPLLRQLQAQGFNRRELPSSVGGSWVCAKQFVGWRRERLVTEELMEVACIADSKEAMHRAQEVIQCNACRQDKRDKDREYARRKRQRVRDDTGRLEIQIEQLRADKQKIGEEFRRLTSLTEEAARVVQSIDPQLRFAPYASGAMGLYAQQNSLLPRSEWQTLHQQRLNPLSLGLLGGVQEAVPSLFATVPGSPWTHGSNLRSGFSNFLPEGSAESYLLPQHSFAVAAALSASLPNSQTFGSRTQPGLTQSAASTTQFEELLKLRGLFPPR